MSHGGVRAGAGRPKGKGKYGGEATKVMRIPASQVDSIKQLIKGGDPHKVPLYSCAVKAGFPSPAEDYIEDMLDLNQYLIKHPAATFIVKASGDSMINAGIFPGSLLVVDRSIEPSHGKIVIAALDGELTVKRLSIQSKKAFLVAENDAYPAIEIQPDSDATIWGVVTSVIQEFD